MLNFIDPNVDRKDGLVKSHLATNPINVGDFPTFSIVEFNITELCNRTCSFCPRADPDVYPNRNEFLQLDLYEKIMRDLEQLDYSGTILYSGFCEPFLHKQLDQLIILSKKYCKKARVECVTNGDLVTVEKLRWLFDAGLDTLLISMYDGPEQEGHFRELSDQAGLREEQVILRVRYLPPEQRFGLTLSNRAGMVTLGELGVTSLTEPLEEKCYYPYYIFMVDFDGVVLLCPHDWGKRLKAGNLMHQSVVDVWTGKPITFARQRLSQANRQFSPCNVCDVQGTLMGEDHFEKWVAYQNTA